MELTEKQLRQLINAQVRKIALEEGWAVEKPVVEASTPAEETASITPESLQEEFEKVEASGTITDIDAWYKANKADGNPSGCLSYEAQMGLNKMTLPATTPVNDDVVNDVKKLNEEFKRMKQLIDFRSPLLNK